jgi:phosphatidylglycerophosphatase A
MEPATSRLTDRLAELIGTVFWLGKLPGAPGTYGALAACTLAWFAPDWLRGTPGAFPWAWLLGALIFSAACLWATAMLERRWGPDPSAIVADEFAGMWLALTLLPQDGLTYLVAFVLFRFLDIYKPLGIRRLESVPGPWGVLLDDLAAGVFAWLPAFFYAGGI